MKKLAMLMLMVTIISAQGLKLDLMGGIGITKGCEVLNDELFKITLQSGANYGLRAQAIASNIGIEFYYTLNTLEPDAIDKLTNGVLDFSDKFANYGIGLILQGKGFLAPYLSLDYGKTKFLGEHKYAPDGKHYSVGLGLKFMPTSIGLWGEARLLRVSDLFKDLKEFTTEGKFTTFSVTVGGVFRF